VGVRASSAASGRAARVTVLKRSGSFAWVQDRREGGVVGEPRRTLMACRISSCARGANDAPQPTVVADGFDVEAKSLTVRGSRIHWIEAGQRRSARL
jgi:hypothetical protein